ncbi:TonB-dependent receptor plug domain-containing protein [Planctomycetota bacterium]
MKKKSLGWGIKLCFVLASLWLCPGVLAVEDILDANALLDLSLDDLLNVKIESVSRVSEKLDDAPGTAYVITQEMIKRRGYSSLKDLLQVIPGFNVFHKDLQYVAAVRGLSANDNEKVTLLINGVEMNQANEPDFLNGPINLDSVDRVEVIVGPSSIFRPANTLVATVNVITKEVQGLETAISAGTALDYGVSLMGGHHWSKEKKFSLVGTVERRKGFDSWDTSRSVSPMTNFAGYEYTGKSYRPNYFTVFSGQYNKWSGQFVMHDSTFPELRLGGSTQESRQTAYVDTMKGGYLQYETPVAESMVTKASYSMVYKEVDRASATASWLYIQQTDHNVEYGVLYTGWQGHTLQFGVQGLYEDNTANGDNFGESSVSSQEPFFDKDTWGIGAYLDDSIQITDQFKFVAGLRGDYNTLLKDKDNAGIHWGGRLAGIYSVLDQWTTKLMFNRAVRMPSPLAAINEIWGIDAPSSPSWAAGAPTAQDPEILQTLEWTNIWYPDKTRVSLTAYYQWLEHFITWGSPYTNVGDYEGWGLECDIKHHLTDTLTPWINGSYVSSEFDTYDSFDAVANAGDAHSAVDPDKRLIGAPGITVNTGIDWYMHEHVTLTSQLRYWTDQPVEVTHDGGTTTYFTHVTDQFYLDATLLFKNIFREGIDIRVAGTNLLNNRNTVAGPWIIGQYHPCGAAVEVKAYIAF